MNFDLMTLPTTFDMAHGGLSLLSLVLIVLYISKGGEKLVEVVKEKIVEKPVEVIKEKVVEVVKEIEKPVEIIKEVEVIKEIELIKEIEVVKEIEKTLKQATPDAALQLLTLLQQEARFIDFVQEDLSGFADAEIGAAARVIHSGSQKVLADYFTFDSVRSEEEESRISLPLGFNASEVRLTGNVVGEAPFNGTLIHRGWQVTDIRLPKLATDHNARIIAPAEVEL